MVCMGSIANCYICTMVYAVCLCDLAPTTLHCFNMCCAFGAKYDCVVRPNELGMYHHGALSILPVRGGPCLFFQYVVVHCTHVHKFNTCT
jgi:hypothetical protein